MRLDLGIETANHVLGTLSTFLRGQEAYLDPGSGSYLVQLLIAGLVGGLFAIRASWDKLKNLFRGRSSEEEEASTDEEQS